MWFIPNPNAQSEDDGILITIVFDGEKAKSYVLLMDAITFSPVNMAYLPHAIPWSAHGNTHFIFRPNFGWYIALDGVRGNHIYLIKPKMWIKELFKGLNDEKIS